MRSPLDAKLPAPRGAIGVDLLLQRIGVARLHASINIPAMLKNQIIFVTGFADVITFHSPLP
jgi:hypothetical protein